MRRFLIFLLVTSLLPICVSVSAEEETADTLDKYEIVFALELMDKREDMNAEVTRGEFAEVLSSFITFVGSGAETPPDINENDIYYDSVMLAVSSGIMRPYADGLFRAGTKIEYEDVIQALFDAAGYKEYAKYYGESGYSQLAARSDMPSAAETVTRELLVKVIYSYIDVPFFDTAVFSAGGGATYELNREVTTLTELLGIRKKTGILWATDAVSYDVGDLARGELSFEGAVYTNASDRNYDEFAGRRGDCYYRENSGGKYDEAIYIDFYKYRGSTLTIAAKNLRNASLEEIQYEEYDGKSKRVRLAQSLTVCYNGKLLSGVIDEDFEIQDGEIVLCDNDGDGIYDTAAIWEKQTIVVERVDFQNGIVYDKFNGETYDIDENSYDSIIARTPGSGRVSSLIYNIEAGNVLELYLSADKRKLTADISSETAKITVVSVDEERVYSQEGEYELSEYFKRLGQGLDVSEGYLIYLNSKNEVAACEKYDVSAWRVGFCTRYVEDFDNEVGIIKIFEDNGEFAAYNVAEKAKLKEYVSLNYLEEKYLCAENVVDHLIKYRLNISGEVKEIILPADNTDRSKNEERFSDTAFSKDFASPSAGIRIWNYTTCN